MSKRYLSKEWLGLDQAAQALSVLVKEDFNVADIVSYVVDKRLKLYWFISSGSAMEVALACPHSFDLLEKFSAVLSDEELYGQPIEYRQTVSSVKDFFPLLKTKFMSVNASVDYSNDARLDGFYQIDLKNNPDVESGLRNLLVGNSYELYDEDGVFVTDITGRHYQLLEYYSSNDVPTYAEECNVLAAEIDDKKRSEKAHNLLSEMALRIANLGLGAEIKKEKLSNLKNDVLSIGFGDFRDDENAKKKKKKSSPYYPAYTFPEVRELFVSTRDLTELSASLTGSVDQSDKQLSAKGENSYIRLIDALVACCIGGSTGEVTKDAAVCIAKLKEAGIDPPVKERAIYNYLKKAKELRNPNE